MATIVERFDRDGNAIGWQATVRRKGHNSKSKTCRTKREVELWAATVESDIGHGRFVDTRSAEKITLAELIERYRIEITPKKRGADREESKLNVMGRHPIARRPVATLTGTDIARYRDDRLKEVSSGTVSRELSVLGNIFTVARREWQIHLPRGNPVGDIRKPSDAPARDRRLEAGEEERLIAASLQYEKTTKALRMASIIKLALATAMRRGEIAGMRWENVDLKKRSIFLPKTKNGESRSVPLSTIAITVLESLEKREDGWVWGCDIDEHSITRAFDRICKRAEISNLRFHDLRHEAVSRFFEMNRLSDMQIAKISGHKTMKMLARYTHLRASDLADLLDGKPPTPN